MNNQLAQIQIAPNGGFKGLGTGPLGNPTGNGIGTLTSLISAAVGIMTLVAIIWFIFIFMTGAIGIITSGGDKGSYEAARKKITTGLIGLVVVIIAVFAVDLVGYLLGFSTSILDLPTLFGLIK